MITENNDNNYDEGINNDSNYVDNNDNDQCVI